jgi:hypothetical protein
VTAFSRGGEELSAEEVAALSALRFDCNGNDEPDDVEIDLGVVADADGNGIPDPCEQGTAAAAPDAPRRAAALQLAPPVPNPTGMATAVRYTLADAGPATIEVFDLGGRRVRALWSGLRPAGEHEARWDGRDEGGRPVASGIYLVVARGAGGSVARAVTVRR